ncbi:MAG: HD domain-containing protein, partial [Actinomycetales bacterium]
MNAMLTPVAKRVRESNPNADLSVIDRAFEQARISHEGQLRKSGDPYITHPVAVAEILAELGLDPNTIAAALLHDTVEDTNYSQEQLRIEFGEEIASLVEGVTKL